MNILILGGRSKRHYEWVRELASKFMGSGLNATYYDYTHWQTDAEKVDIEDEIVSISKFAFSFGEYIIVAKSIGTVIATLGVAAGKLTPKGCVFLGVPANHFGQDLPDIRNLFTRLPKTFFIQNHADPLGSSTDIGEILQDYHPCDWDLITNSGDTHDYIDFNGIVDRTKELIK